MIGVDGGNTKTDLARRDGSTARCSRRCAGRGSNSHGLGSAGAVAVDRVARGRRRVRSSRRARRVLPLRRRRRAGHRRAVGRDRGAVVDARGDRRQRHVRAASRRHRQRRTPSRSSAARGSTASAAAQTAASRAIRRSAGRPATGAAPRRVGREALFLAARAEDGRGEATALVDVVRSHFELPSAYAVGEAVHYRRLRDVRLGELAPAVVAAAGDGDAVARALVERLANEIVLMVRRALARPRARRGGRRPRRRHARATARASCTSAWSAALPRRRDSGRAAMRRRSRAPCSRLSTRVGAADDAKRRAPRGAACPLRCAFRRRGRAGAGARARDRRASGRGRCSAAPAAGACVRPTARSRESTADLSGTTS